MCGTQPRGLTLTKAELAIAIAMCETPASEIETDVLSFPGGLSGDR